MYGDLINQIAKYLKPKERYYLYLEIKEKHNNIVYTFYLIYELNDYIKMKYKIRKISYYSVQKFYFIQYVLNDTIINNSLLIYIGDKIGVFTSPYKSKKFLFIEFKNMELRILESSIGNFDVIKYHISKNVNNKDSIPDTTIHTFRINKKSVEEIKEGIKVFRRIMNSNLVNAKLSEKDKKYIKIDSSIRG